MISVISLLVNQLIIIIIWVLLGSIIILRWISVIFGWMKNPLIYVMHVQLFFTVSIWLVILIVCILFEYQLLNYLFSLTITYWLLIILVINDLALLSHFYFWILDVFLRFLSMIKERFSGVSNHSRTQISHHRAHMWRNIHRLDWQPRIRQLLYLNTIESL